MATPYRITRPIRVTGGNTYRTETLAGAATIAADGPNYILLDPDGVNRNVGLPAEASSEGCIFYIFNTGAVAADLVVRNDTPATIATLAIGMWGVFGCNGTAWALLYGGYSGVMAAGFDFGAGGLLTDSIEESTGGAGVTIQDTLKVDTIAEDTAGVGVSIEGISLKDDTATFAAGAGHGIVLDSGASLTDQAGGVTALLSGGGGTLLIDDEAAVADGGDPTKRARVDAGNVTAGQTRAITAPDFDIDLAHGLLLATGTIATASVKTLNATPVQVIAAPAAGQYIEVESCEWFLDYNSAAYDSAAAGDSLALKYTNGAGAAVAEVVPGNTIGAAAADYHTVVRGVQGPLIPAVAAAIVAHINTGEWFAAAGDSPLKYRILYRIRTLAT